MGKRACDLIAEGAYDEASDNSTDDGSGWWDRDTVSTMDPVMASKIKQLQMEAERNRIHKWLGAVGD